MGQASRNDLICLILLQTEKLGQRPAWLMALNGLVAGLQLEVLKVDKRKDSPGPTCATGPLDEHLAPSGSDGLRRPRDHIILAHIY